MKRIPAIYYLSFLVSLAVLCPSRQPLLSLSNPISAEDWTLNSVDPINFGAVFGARKDKSTRLNNWQSFKEACLYAVQNNLPVQLDGVLEIEVLPGNWIELKNGDRIEIHGINPEQSIVDVYPKVGVATQSEYGIFKAVDEGVSIHIEKCQFQGPKNLDRLQTYRAILKYNGNANTIKIQPAEKTWSGLWDNIQPGDEILYAADYLNKIGYSGTVKSINREQGTLILEEDLHSSMGTNIQSEQTHIGLFWPEDIDENTVNDFSKNWYDGDLDQFFISYVVGFHKYAIPATITFKDVILENFLSILNRSGGNIQLTIENSKIAGIKTGIGFFTGEKADNPSAIQISNMELYNCGLVADGGSINRSYVSAGQPPIWGSGFYIHPNVVVTMHHSHIHDNPGGAFRQYSSSGASSKPARKGLISIFENNKFKNNGEFSLLTSGVMHSKISNCTFDGFGMLKLNYASEVTNCSFDVPLALDSSNDPNYEAESVFNVRFENCRFNPNAQFTSGGWEPEELNKVVLAFNDCEFFSNAHPISASPQPFLKIRSDFGDAAFPVNFTNCTINFPESAEGIDPDVKGVGEKVSPFLRIGPNYSGKITIENLTTNNNNRKVFLYNGLEFERPYFNAQCTIKNSDLSSWLWLQGMKTRNSFKHVVQLEGSPFFGDAVNSLFYVNSFRPGQTTKKIDKENFYYGDEVYHDNLVVDDEFDTYQVGGNSLKTITYYAFNLINPNSNYHGGSSNHRFKGKITIIPQEDLTVVPYGIDKRSNIAGEQTFTLTANEPVTFRCIPDECLTGDEDNVESHTVTIGKGDGSKTNFMDNSPGSEDFDSPIPGSIRLITDDGIDIAADHFGKIDHQGVQGVINPYNHDGGWELNFSVPPSSGSTITKVYQTYRSCDWQGYWKLEKVGSQAILQVQPKVNGPLLCADDHSGTIDLDVSGGQPPYNIQWASPELEGIQVNGLAPGSYTVTITDADNESIVQNIQIDSPEPLKVDLVENGSTDCETPTKNIIVHTEGGQKPYTYRWSDGIIAAEERSLAEGNYQVTVTDNNGCTATGSIEIRANNTPNASFSYSINNKRATFETAVTLEQAQTWEWSFGDGNTSKEASPSHEYEVYGVFEVCLTVQNNCGADIFCETIRIDEQSEIATVSFSIGMPRPVERNLIEIPVTTSNFKDLLSFEFALGIPTGNGASFAGISTLDIPYLSDRSFVIESKKAYVTWRNPTTQGISVNDDEVVFSLLIELPTAGTCSDVFFYKDNQKDDISVFGLRNNIKTVFPYQFTDGEICSENPRSLRGKVSSPDGVYPLENITVTCSGLAPVKTAPDGTFQFDDLPALTETIEVKPVRDDDAAKGISIIDLINVRRHILQLAPFSSPYQYIAADVNRSGRISSLDLLLMQQLILGRKDRFPKGSSWIFIPAQHEFSKLDSTLAEPYPESILLGNSEGITDNFGFLAVKLGDVDYSFIKEQFGSSASPNGSLNFVLENKRVLAGETISIEVTAENFEGMVGYQLEWHYDKDNLTLLDISHGHLSDVQEEDFIWEERRPGLISNLWYSEKSIKEGQSLSNNLVLFTFHFKVLNDLEIQHNLWSGAENLKPEAFKVDHGYILPQITFQDPEVTEIDLTLYPNPTTDRIFVNLVSPKAEQLTLRIFNTKGQLVEQTMRQDLDGPGPYFYPIDTEQLSSGTYLLQVQLGKEHFTKKFIKN